MRASQFVKLLLGPTLAAFALSAAVAGSMHEQESDSSILLPILALIAMLATSVGTIVWNRRERRRFKRDIGQKRCQCCGNAMHGIVDIEVGPLWRCVECMRDEEVLFSLPS
jgi:hypothetical protein